MQKSEQPAPYSLDWRSDDGHSQRARGSFQTVRGVDPQEGPGTRRIQAPQQQCVAFPRTCYSSVRAGAARKGGSMFRRDGSRYWYTRIGGVPVSLRTEVASDAEALEGKLKQQHWQETHLGVKPKKSWEQ